eukprot:1162137-Pelagomonas_calceolata.AAC.5
MAQMMVDCMTPDATIVHMETQWTMHSKYDGLHAFEKKNAGLYQNITFPEACRASASIKHGLIARHVDWKPCAFGIC